MSHPQLLSPRPTRPLKRQISLLDSSYDATDEPLAHKRRKCCSLSSPNRVREWLANLLPPLERSRSENDLLCDHDRRWCRRHLEIGGSRSRSSLSGMSLPRGQHLPSPASLRQGGGRLSTIPNSNSSAEEPAISDVITRPNTVSEASQPQAPSFSGSKDDPKKSKRVSLPTYREDLANHNVFIDSFGLTTPESIHSFGTNIIQRERKSPSLDKEGLLSIREELSELVSADETATRAGFDATRLFPSRRDYGGRIATGGNVPFDQTALPYTPGLGFLPIVTPKPDLQYGYPQSSFSPIEVATMQHNRLQPLAHPTTASYWPFFLVEFKSTSRGGSRWVAENQNAASGAHCVNALETLLNYSRSPESPRKSIDSVTFSCVAEADFGSIWVHWNDTEQGPPRFISSDIGQFSLKTDQDLQSFRTSIRNIIDYGINERLSNIKVALDKTLVLIPQWNTQDKIRRVRRRTSSQLDKEEDKSGKSKY